MKNKFQEHSRLLKQLYDNFHKELDKVIILVTDLQGNITKENIRKLRLSIKKINTFFRWFEQLTVCKFANKHLCLLRKLFKSTGQLCGIQVQLNLINAYQTNDFYSFGDYRHQLDIAYDKHLILFANEIKCFDVGDLSKHHHVAHFLLFDVLSDDEILPKTKAYIRQRITQIRFLLEKPTTNNLHKIRVLFKEIFDLFRILNKVHYKAPLLYLKVKKLKAFSRQIGIWQDRAILYEGIKDFNGMVRLSAVKGAIKRDVRLQKKVILEEFHTMILPILEGILMLIEALD